MLTRYLLTLFLAIGLFSTASAQTRFVKTFNTVAEMLAANPNDVHTNATLLGYYSPNDGGGGPVYYDKSNSATETAGTYWKPNSYNGRWIRVIENGRTSSRQWGVFPGSVTPEKVAILNSAISWNATNGYETFLDTGDHRPQTNIVLVSNARIVGAPESVWLRDYVLQSRYDKALFSIANAPLPTDSSVTAVPIVATNVSLQNVIVGAVATNKLGPLIAFLGVDHGRIQNCEVRPGAYDWSITWYGNNGIITGNRIKSVYPDSGSTIFTDGIHVLGGTNGVIANNVIESGDDNIAFTTFNNAGISHWTVSGNSHKAWRANALRFQQESAYATNLIQHISITGGSGEAGLLRNGTILFYNPSATNNPYPFRNISISHYKLRGGGLDGQPTPVGLSYGIYATGVDGLTLNDVSLGNTPYGNYIFACKDITINNCKMTGGLYSSGFLSPLRVQDSIDLTIMGGRYVPDLSTVASVQVVSVTNSFIGGGIYIEGKSSAQPALLYSLYNGSVKLIGAKVYNSASGGASVVFANDPLNAVIAGNTLSATTPLFWSTTGLPPKGSRVHWNEGIPEKETDATTFDVLNTANNGYVGSLNSRANATKLQLQATNGMITLAQDGVSGGSKNIRLGFQPTVATNNDNAFAYSSDNGSASQLTINGGTANMNSHQILNLNITTNSYEGTGWTAAQLTYRGLRLEKGVTALASPDSFFQVVTTEHGSRPVPLLTTAQANAISVQNPGLFFYDTDETSPAVSTAASTSYYRYLLPRISSDRGDANVTLTSIEAETQIFATTLTANRTVTLPASNVRKGDKFRIVRTGLGSFTLAVGGVKTIPASTAATVDVQHNGTAWQLAGYMEHVPSGGGGGVPTGRLLNTQYSLTGGGDLSADRTLNLVNDTASPGANKVYGTDGSGVRGWKNDPSGGGSGLGYGGTSTTSISFGTGSKVWTTQTNLAYIAGSRIRAVETGSSQWMEGEIISYSGGTLTVSVDLFSGVGTYSNWGFSIAGVRGAQGIGFTDGDYGQISISGGVTSISIDAGAVSTTELGGDITTAGKDLLNDANAAAQRTTLGLAIGTNVEAWDADLDGLAGLSLSGLVSRTGAGTFAARTLTAPAAGLTVSNGDGVSGNPTLALANDLSAVEGLSGTGIARRTGTDAWSVGTTVSIAEGGTGQTTAKAAFDALNGAEATVASASTTDIGAASSDKVSITGTTTITSFGTVAAGVHRLGRFTGALTLTHNATSLILPGGASLTTAAGDRFQAVSLGSGNWVVYNYVTASRTGTGADVQQNSPNFTGSPQVNGNDIGTLDILQNSQSANYTLVLGDRGKHIFHPSSDANSRTFTIPANASVAFPVGTAVTFINASANSCTIAITTDTLWKAGTGTTGSVSLPQHAVATAIKVTTTGWYISGNGI